LTIQRSASDPLLEIGLFLVVVAAPLVFTPFTAAPFVDPKLWLLTGGALVIALSRPRVDRTLSLAAAAFVAAVALATIFSVDRWWSLISTESRGMGLIGLAASALLLCAGTGVPEDFRARLPRWLFWTGVVVSVVAVVARFVSLGTNTWRLDPFSATIGHRALVGGFLAAAALAVLASPVRAREVAGLLILGSGISVTAARGALIGLVLGFAVIFVRTSDWHRIVLVFLPLLVAVLAWTAVSTIHPPKDRNQLGYSGAQRFTQLNEGSALQRPAAFKAFARAWEDDPILGSGPGTAWKPYLDHVRPAEIRVAGRGFADTHNIFLEFAVTTGTVGLLAFIALLVLVLRRLRRAPRERAWGRRDRSSAR
jgi:O-antigen ligase